MFEMFTKGVACSRCTEGQAFVAVAYDPTTREAHSEGVLATDCDCRLDETDEHRLSVAAVRATLRDLEVAPCPAPSAPRGTWAPREVWVGGVRLDTGVVVQEGA